MSLFDNPYFRRITPGIETLPGNFTLPRHRHFHAYATVVLAGSFEEAGYAGRIRATAGDLLIHPVLDCHANHMVSDGLKLLRLNWPDTETAGGLHRLKEIDELARRAEKSVDDARLLLAEVLRTRQASPTPEMKNDWPDLLAAELARNSSIELGAWANEIGLARETVSRGFTAAYNVTPAMFRAELRARTAWLQVTRGSACLSSIAAETGFADQSHMTRWILRLTGASPAVWRRNLIVKDTSRVTSKM